MSDIDPMTLSKHHDMQRYDLPGDGGQYDLELDPVADGGYVLWEDHVEALRQAATRERLNGQVQMMDEIARCIGDGHRGNGSAEGDVCCQVCQEIQCDPD